jgi:hypothetical protein
MLKTHIDAVEKSLLAISQIPQNSGHSLHKGTPREAFIRQFLASHLSARAAIGTGEIIDANSKPGQQRNQYDIVLYTQNYPKLDFGGGISGFLVESVTATIEVKSTLTKEEFFKATSAAKNAKSLTKNLVRSFSTGYVPPSIISVLVAYDGPASMETVHGWVADAEKSFGFNYPMLPKEEQQRYATPSPAIDAVFVLGKGFMHFGNAPFGFFHGPRVANDPLLKWAIVNGENGNLLMLFMMLTTAFSGTTAESLSALPYLSNFSVQLNFGQ